MSVEVLLTFIAACVLLALTPGPNMALMIANTLRSGLRGGLVTLAGTTTGLALLVAAAAAGMTSIMQADPVGQLTVLAVVFVAVLATVDIATTFAVARARATFSAARLRFLDCAAGVFLLLGGLALAVMRRP